MATEPFPAHDRNASLPGGVVVVVGVVVGLLVCWSVGLLVCWSVGLLVGCSFGWLVGCWLFVCFCLFFWFGLGWVGLVWVGLVYVG